ncbi:hypothetical protein ACFLQ6_07660, partial [Thermoproteota archaeon]
SGFIAGMCSNRQYDTVDTDPTVVDLSTGAPKLQNKIIVLFGGPDVNAVVNYYEDNRISQLYWGKSSRTYYMFTADGTRLDNTGMTLSQIWAQKSDIFIIQVRICLRNVTASCVAFICHYF